MADKNLRLQIITPVKRLYDGDVKAVSMRGIEGSFGVLPMHEPFTTVLSYGILKITTLDGSELRATVFGGFVEVLPNKIVVLSDSAEWPEEIDKERALASKERAEDRLKSPDKYDVKRAELALSRALVRIEAASYVPHK